MAIESRMAGISLSSVENPNLKTAVLFLVFNRPNETKRSFEAIRLARPPRLYIAADGPRKECVGEVDKAAEVRRICTEIDWPCTVSTLFRARNLGCKEAVSKAITWFFEHEEMGIIIEDDVVPNDDFFKFTEHCLLKFKDDKRVMMVTGTSYFNRPSLEVGYFMTQICSIWGWATWRRAWDLYDVEMRAWSSDRMKLNLKHKFGSDVLWRYFKNMFDAYGKNAINTWDIQWAFTCASNNGLCATPKVNLVSNVGVVGTHSESITDSHFMPKCTFPVSSFEDYDPLMIPDAVYEDLYIRKKILPNRRIQFVISVLKVLRTYKILRWVKHNILLKTLK